MKKIIVLLCSFLFLGIVLLGCNNKDNSKKTKITVAEVTHSVFYAPWYVALENGYFEEYELDIEVMLTPGADKVGAAVLSGDAEIGLSGIEATIYVYDEEADDYLVSFASLTKRDGQFLVGDCDLKEDFSVNDLTGKTVLAGRTGGMPAMVFEYGLYKNGLTRDEVKIDNSVEFAALSGAYIGGVGEFVNLFEPTALKLEKENYGCVLTSIGLLSGEVPYTVYHTKKSYLENNEKVIKKFSEAIDKGLDFVKNNNEEKIAKVIFEQFPDTSMNDLIAIVKRYKEADSWYDNTHISKSAFDRILEIMVYNNALNKDVDYEKIVNNELNGHS